MTFTEILKIHIIILHVWPNVFYTYDPVFNRKGEIWYHYPYYYFATVVLRKSTKTSKKRPQNSSYFSLIFNIFLVIPDYQKAFKHALPSKVLKHHPNTLEQCSSNLASHLGSFIKCWCLGPTQAQLSQHLWRRSPYTGIKSYSSNSNLQPMLRNIALYLQPYFSASLNKQTSLKRCFHIVHFQMWYLEKDTMWLRVYNLNLITQNHQTNSKWEKLHLKSEMGATLFFKKCQYHKRQRKVMDMFKIKD